MAFNIISDYRDSLIASPYCSFQKIYFLSAISLRRTSKDLNFLPSSFLLYWDKIFTKIKILTNQHKQSIPPKELLWKNPPKNSSQKIPPKKSSQKIPPKNFPSKNSSKKILQKKFQKKSKKIPKNPKKKSNTSSKKDFENIQFPSSDLEAENPFGLVFKKTYKSCF